MDDAPVGKGAGDQMMGASAKDQADNSGPLEKRIVSKNWSVRAEAYAELTTMCKGANRNSKADFFKEHCCMWKEYLKDSNPGALEKALSCLENFLDKIHPSILIEFQNDILGVLVEKCFDHAKVVIKQKGTDCLLVMFEVSETFEEATDALNALISHKNVKVLIGGIRALSLLLDNFSHRKIKISQYQSNMIKNAQSTNPECKKASYEYYTACYKWVGDAILPSLEPNLKKTQMDELHVYFKTEKEKTEKTKRSTRTEQKNEEENKKNTAIEAAIQQEKAAEEVVDLLEFSPEVDVLGKFNGEWLDAVEAIKKPEEKKTKIIEITKACDNVKIKKGSTENIVKFLKKEIDGNNVFVSIEAMKAAACLAGGLKEHFGPCIKEIICSVLLKQKEKKQQVVDAIKAVLDASMQCSNLEEIKDGVFPKITDKVQYVRAGTVKYVEKLSIVTYIDVLQRVADELLSILLKVVDDKEGEVREAALHCMGILRGRLGEEALSKYLKDINAQKLAKIDEAAKEVQASKYDRPQNWKPPAPKAAPKKKAVAKDEAEDEDALMTFDAPKKVKKPPPNIGQKPPKKVVAENEEMTDEELPPPKAPPKKAKVLEVPQDEEEKRSSAPPKKAPAQSSAKPKAATAASSTKGPTAPVIQEEDLGSGVSKEEAIDKVNEYYDSSVIKKFEEDKWQTKKEGFEELEKLIIEKQPPVDVLEATAKFVKAKMKDWKESNINLMKCIVSIFNCIVNNSDRVNRRTIQCGMSFFVDKLGDVKMVAAIKEMLIVAAEQVTPKFIALQIIKYAATAKAPGTLKESCNQISIMIDEFGMNSTPLKETIDYAKLAIAHANPDVRKASQKIFCSMYKHSGDKIRVFMEDIKEATLKVINDDLSKITPYQKGEYQPIRRVKGEAAEEIQAGAGKGGKGKEEDDPFASLPREDISKKLNAKLMEKFKNADWKKRSEAGQDVEAILKEAKMRIQPTGLNELMDAMKNGMKDANKAVVKVFIGLLGLLAEAIGPQVKQFTKKVFFPLLGNLSDKQSLVRDETVATMSKWSEQIGPEAVINQLSSQLLIENPELRSYSLIWILKNEGALKDIDHKEMVKPIIACLLDKSKAIREQAEKVIEHIMPFTGYQDFLNATKDHKTAVQQTLKPILERIKGTSGASLQGGAPAQKSQKVEVEEVKQSAAPVVQNSFSNKANQKQAEEQAKKDKAKVQSDLGASMMKTQQIQSSRGNQEEDEYTITVLQKAKRAQYDSRTKYPLNEIKGDHIEKIQLQCQEAFGLKFHDLMFAKAVDFKKHIQCVEQFEKFIKSCPDKLSEVIDIIFKWTNLRMMESANTQLIISIFDFYFNLLKMLIEQDYKLQEFEILVLLGTLCDKVGLNNKTLQDKARKIIRMCYELYDKKQCYRIILDRGIKNANLKSVAECLDEVADFIKENGVDCVTKKDFQSFVLCCDSKDKDVRENALKVFAETYVLLGEQVWTLIKDIPLKVKGLLEQRFKQVTKKTGNGLESSLGNAKIGGLTGIQARGTAVNFNSDKNNLINSLGNKQNLNNSLGGVRDGGLKFNKPSNTITEASNAVQMNDQNQSLKSNDAFNISEIRAPNSFLANDSEHQQKMSLIEDSYMEDVQNQSQMPGNFTQSEMRNKFYEEANVPMDQGEQDEYVEQVKQGISPQESKTSSKPQNQKQVQQPPAAQNNNLVMDEEGDEIQQLLKEAENNLDVDPALREQQQFILNHIRQLKIGDLLKRVDSLVALNEVISATTQSDGQDEKTQQKSQSQAAQRPHQQKALIQCCNELINAFTYVMNDIFRYPVNDLPLRFTKYFITIVNKTCSSKEIMREVSEKSVHDLVEQLLTRLLIENLDKIGQNKEGELILKNLNSSMLRMLENCNHTYIFGVLFKLMKNFKEDSSLPKLPSLIIKCLLRLSKLMDKLIKQLDLGKFLVYMHEYMVTIDYDNKSPNDDLGVRIMKTLINELVKHKGESIWQSYTLVENHSIPDVYIRKWIQITIKSISLTANNPSTSRGTVNQVELKEDFQQPPQSRMYTEFEFKKILQDLRDPQKYDQGIQKLQKFSNQNPSYDYIKNLEKETDVQINVKKIVNSLNQLKIGNSWQSTNNSDNLGGHTQSQEQPHETFKGQRNVPQMKANPSVQNLQGIVGQKQQFGVQQNQNDQQQKNDLNLSLSKMSVFESKMQKLQNRNSNVNSMSLQGSNLGNSNQEPSLSNSAMGAGRLSTMVGAGAQGGAQQNLNTSFSDLNSKLSQKWALINSGSKKQANLTGRPLLNNQSQQNLSQTMSQNNGGFQQNTGNSGTNANLNSSNNKFQSKVQVSFSSRIQQNKVQETSSSGQQKDVQNKQFQNLQVNDAAYKTQQAQQQQFQQPNVPQKPPSTYSGAQTPSKKQSESGLIGGGAVSGGISVNSFKSRIQGFGQQSQNAQGSNNNSSIGVIGGMQIPQQQIITSQTNAPSYLGQSGAGGLNTAASSQDLQKRLADMKAKMQGIKNVSQNK